jgi:tetratricopeptide (TPR) repeat protein
MKEAVSILRAYAFITPRDTQDGFDMHRLVRLVMRKWVQEKGEWEIWITKVVQRLKEEFPYPGFHNKSVWTRYLPHGQAILGIGQAINNGIEYIGFLTTVANCYWILGNYSEVERLCRDARDLSEKALGAKHPNTLDSINNIAVALERQGKNEEAEKLHRELVKLSNEVLGGQDPATLQRTIDLGAVLIRQRKLEEAERLHRKTLELCTTALGNQHSSTIICTSSLAVVLGRQGKYKEAEGMQRQVAELNRKAHGEQDPSTIACMNNLAAVLVK